MLLSRFFRNADGARGNLACSNNYMKMDFHEVITAKEIHVTIKFRSVHLEVRAIQVRGLTGRTGKNGMAFVSSV